MEKQLVKEGQVGKQGTQKKDDGQPESFIIDLVSGQPVKSRATYVLVEEKEVKPPVEGSRPC